MCINCRVKEAAAVRSWSTQYTGVQYRKDAFLCVRACVQERQPPLLYALLYKFRCQTKFTVIKRRDIFLFLNEIGTNHVENDTMRQAVQDWCMLNAV